MNTTVKKKFFFNKLSTYSAGSKIFGEKIFFIKDYFQDMIQRTQHVKILLVHHANIYTQDNI